MITDSRKYIHEYFVKHLAPMIRLGAKVEDIQSLANIMGIQYTCVVKQYSDSIRVSANLKSNGIIFFMAETKEGKEDYDFKEPSYNWRN